MPSSGKPSQIPFKQCDELSVNNRYILWGNSSPSNENRKYRNADIRLLMFPWCIVIIYKLSFSIYTWLKKWRIKSGFSFYWMIVKFHIYDLFIWYYNKIITIKAQPLFHRREQWDSLIFSTLLGSHYMEQSWN